MSTRTCSNYTILFCHIQGPFKLDILEKNVTSKRYMAINIFLRPPWIENGVLHSLRLIIRNHSVDCLYCDQAL